MLEVVAELCGLQAQVMSSTSLALWARVEGLAPADVSDALWKHRTLVKTWAMRGTLHLLPSHEYRLWQSALSTNRNYLRPSWLKYFGVTSEELDRLIVGIETALDGNALTRTELAARVAAITGSPEIGGRVLQGWGTLLKPAAFRGSLCFGPSVGQNVRFTAPGSWLGRSDATDSQLALREVTRRFFRVHGPASRADYAQWSGLGGAAARREIEALEDELTSVTIDGADAWMLTNDVHDFTRASPPKSVRLLPAFDQYVIVASRHAENLMPGPLRPRVYRSQGWLTPVLLIDGRMDGIWSHTKKGPSVEIRIEPFTKVAKWARRAAEQEAQRLGVFLGAPAEVIWDT